MLPKIYPPESHAINLDLIDSDALTVIDKLKSAGFVAYLVGGSVRDLLLKTSPKDFDISTSAPPEEIKKIFGRSCLLIGRRFRLAHIRFGHKIIEVSTFRTGDSEDNLIVQDNRFGTPEEDVLRRDFTINGLFYDPETHSVIDYVGGWEDIQKRTLKTIGTAEVRFRQDPVRMIRLLKFRARFGFNIEANAKKALIACKDEILKSSPARLLEEVLRMLESGAAAPFFSLMIESGLCSLLLPAVDLFAKQKQNKDIFLFLTAADKVNQRLGKKPLDRSVLFSCLLYPLIEAKLKQDAASFGRPLRLGEIILVVSSIMKEVEGFSFIKFPKRLTVIAISILTTQYRMTPMTGKTHMRKALGNKDFVFALNFLKLRALVDKDLIDTYTSWKKLQREHEHQKDRVHHMHRHHHRLGQKHKH